ncbi:MAG: universal stress protein [Desulfobacterales bacterium]|jgi:nucleotide-binding universal stress UspA family protein
MQGIHTVMVAIGFSSYSEGTFRYAAELARKFDADLLVASVINSRDVEAVRSVAALGYKIDGEHYVESIRNERKALLEGYVKKTSFPAEKMTVRLPVGNPLEELLKTIVREEVQMVVMGVKERSDLEHIFVGSVAEKIFRRSPVTVISYRDEESAERLRKRIHVSDGNRQ